MPSISIHKIQVSLTRGQFEHTAMRRMTDAVRLLRHETPTSLVLELRNEPRRINLASAKTGDGRLRCQGLTNSLESLLTAVVKEKGTRAMVRTLTVLCLIGVAMSR